MNKNYRLLWSAFLVSDIGDWLQRITLPILVLNTTGSAFHAASLYGVSFLPWLFFSLLGGIFADRYNKVKVLVAGNIIATILSLGLVVSFLQDDINLFYIYVLTFLLSSVEPISHPSFNSLIPKIVSKDYFAKANSNLQLVDNTLNFLAPLLSGFLLLWINPILLLVVNTGSFLVSAILLMFIKITDSGKNLGQNVWQSLREGLVYVKGNKVVLSGSILFLGTNLGIHMFQGIFVYYITKILNYSTFSYGIILSSAGLGAILGALYAPKVLDKFKSGNLIVFSTMLAGLVTILLVMNSNLVFISLLMAIMNFCGNINVISYFTLRQKVVPKEILGRVVSVTRMISYATIPLGAYLGGVLADKGIGIEIVILIAGLIRLSAGVFGYISPLRKGN
ncbi:MFS transporter [Gemella sp. 19428wG2_WT2a]|nr:MFS transporter [Gemella sp. 19428wG2_WT2a]TFU59962.1 MFS transporter [Gemella sp. WT2a]